MDDFDQVERVTRLVGRAAAVGVPAWIVLLAVLPFATGLGPLACLSLATLLAGALVIVVERRRSRRAGRSQEADGAPRVRRPMSAGTAVLLTLGGVALLVYIVFVIQAA